jgi:hypothetical protein
MGDKIERISMTLYGSFGQRTKADMVGIAESISSDHSRRLPKDIIITKEEGFLRTKTLLFFYHAIINKIILIENNREGKCDIKV